MTLLNGAHQFLFLDKGTGEPNLLPIHDMPGDGVVVDCGDKVPSEAKGVIIAAILRHPDGVTMPYSHVQTRADHLTGPNGQAINAVYNYNVEWIGGILFCPFQTGTKRFKYLLSSDRGPDAHVACRGAVIGWF